MFKEFIICCKPDREIRKKIITPGDFTIVPYEDSRCKIRITDLYCRNADGECEMDPLSRIFNSPFDGNVIIGDMDTFVDKDVELILQQMCCGELCIAHIKYKDINGEVALDITCKIELLDVTEEQLVSDWSWARLYESAMHHKDHGVQLVKDKRIVDGFRRFSKAYKMLVAMEPLDRNTLDEERAKELVDLRVKLYNNMAHCQLQFEEFAASLELCCRALRYDPDNIKSLYRRCMAYIGLHMYEEAWDDIQKALTLDPNDKAALLKASELKPHIEKINKDYAKVIKKMFG